MQLNSKDRKILKLLSIDSRTPNAEIAEQVGMSASACWRRIKAFEDEGVINKYGIVIDEERVGFNFRAIVMVTLSRHDPEGGAKFEKAMAESDVVVGCFATTGKEDYNMHVICEDIKAYNEFLDKFLFKLGSVESVQTNVILKDIKRHGIGFS